jgi:predicted small secreted protein
MKLQVLLASLVVATSMNLAGCAKEEGPMEKAGKSMDETASKMQDTAEEAKEDVKEAIDYN